ncbi:MAG TPA: hypothetical protein VM491_04585, partial [Burkholderiaceae bacterium]|nr:hypothetical protein [Burkholderiaceae bacterium]
MRATVNALVFAFCAGLYCVPAQAEDIDIYAGVPSETDLPNVLLILDNSANWSAQIGRTCRLVDRPDYQPSNQERGSKMGIEKCALYNLVHQLPTKPDGGAMFNVGLMLFNESPASHSGGYPRIAFTPLTAQNKARLKSQVFALDVQADKGNNAAFAKTLYEAYLYFSADSPYRGASGTKYDPAAFAAGRYAPPGGGGCGRNFAIFIANGGPGEVTDNEARALLVAAGGNANPILYPNAYVKSSDQANWADEFARFMSGASIGGSSGRNIVTHAIAVTGASSDGIYPNFLRGIAHQGGGSFAEVADADTLTAALLEIFVQIQAVDSVFSSVSLPLAAHSQDTFTNQLFVGMFRPDPLAGPRWYGNLKQYAIAYDPITDSLSLVDRVGRPAISAATGFIEPTAISYWSTSSQFWLNQPSGTPPSESDAPDGEVVEKGGIAQRLRERFADSQSGRALYTCVGCSAGSLLSMSPFVPGHPALTSEMFGTDDPAERDALIAWVRG